MRIDDAEFGEAPFQAFEASRPVWPDAANRHSELSGDVFVAGAGILEKEQGQKPLATPVHLTQRLMRERGMLPLDDQGVGGRIGIDRVHPILEVRFALRL